MKTIINNPNAPAPVGPYNQAVEYGDLLFISGQIAIDQQSGELIQDSIEAETKQVMENLKMILETSGRTFEDVLKATVFVKDMHMYGRINAVYASYFNEESAPARELVEVYNLPKFVNIEISLIAGKK
ncbi:MAG: Rid family detoxifying hydrolase, partial [Bacteroidota bacterium]